MTPTVGDQAPVVAVIGLGYIGLPTAAILATRGADVIGVDVNPETVDAVNRGEVPFVEPDLEASLAGVVSQGRLRAETKTPEADVYVVAVPTPFAEEHAADLSYIEAAADGIAPRLRGGELVILESTSPPGTTTHMAERILNARPDLSLDGSNGREIVHFAHCPERVLPGRIMTELVANDRVVGGLTRAAAEKAKALYATFCQGDILITDAVTAELSKLVENAYRDVNIAFANELSLVAERVGVDAREVIRLANRHPRVNILRPGPGVGGHCIAVDPWFIVSAAPEDARLIGAARRVNDAMPQYWARKIQRMIDQLGARTVSVWGLTYKEDVDDLRESPAVTIAATLAAAVPDMRLLAVEPHLDALPPELAQYENTRLMTGGDALEASDLIVLLVAHKEFLAVRDQVCETPVIDTCGAWTTRPESRIGS